MLRKILKVFAGLQVAIMVMLMASTPAAAADIRGYDDVIIASGDVVNDDLYAAGNRVIINGTVNGDVARLSMKFGFQLSGRRCRVGEVVGENGLFHGRIRLDAHQPVGNVKGLRGSPDQGDGDAGGLCQSEGTMRRHPPGTAGNDHDVIRYKGKRAVDGPGGCRCQGDATIRKQADLNWPLILDGR